MCQTTQRRVPPIRRRRRHAGRHGGRLRSRRRVPQPAPVTAAVGLAHPPPRGALLPRHPRPSPGSGPASHPRPWSGPCPAIPAIPTPPVSRMSAVAHSNTVRLAPCPPAAPCQDHTLPAARPVRSQPPLRPVPPTLPPPHRPPIWCPGHTLSSPICSTICAIPATPSSVSAPSPSQKEPGTHLAATGTTPYPLSVTGLPAVVQRADATPRRRPQQRDEEEREEMSHVSPPTSPPPPYPCPAPSPIPAPPHNQCYGVSPRTPPPCTHPIVHRPLVR